ncbi:ParA family protein (plasmid) [Entomospira entomophila]|uniref:ParA family protein n=1 Tax=Entomospira entomophila TaxID=2719988 RepID=A0A968KS92_9SPIO|nr:ParA family protein [Entomospira entomophilus]NIZ41578.1 ParA family protein [Entomospira entomophilus]WDI36471.1 ParA family protein [Entomospira entomophilus]
MVIALTNIKGGVGKSTLAIHLSMQLQAMNFKILLLDTDYQKTTTHWYENREEEKIPLVIDLMEPISPYQIGCYHHTINQAKANYDFIIIDTAGYESGAMLEIILASDLVLIPSMVSQAELESSVTTMQLAQDHHKQAYILWSRIPSSTNQSKRMQECLTLMHAKALKTIINHRQIYIDSLEQGKVVQEITQDETQAKHKRKGASIASIEIEALTQEILSFKENSSEN